jgi:hypothetical protein
MSFWKNLWRNAFGDPFPTFETMGRYSDIKEREQAGTHDDPLPPPSPPPSCFAKGIAASLRDEPEAWKVIDGEEAFGNTATLGSHIYYLDVKHNATGARVTWIHIYKRLAVSDEAVVNDKWLPEIDATYIISMIKAHPLGQYKVKMDTQRREEEKQAAIHSHFEALGCPPTP